MTTLPIKSNELSNNNLFLFKSDLTNGKEIRVIGTPENPLFIGKDIAEILGYTNTKKAIEDHIDGEDKMKWSQAQKSRGNETLSLKLQAQTILINESGLYSLILRSKLENAKKFKRWITSEVLPSIRKLGIYKLQQDLLLKDNQLLLKDEVIKSIVSEKDMIKKNYSHLEKIHDNLKRTRNYHKFKKGKCCYILHDPWRTDSYYKVGETLDIDQRLQQYRTSMPECKVAFLVYLDDNKLLEKCIKVRYAKELDPCPNHEWVSGGVKLEHIIKSFKMLIRFLKLSVSYEDSLDVYNNPYDPDYKIWPDENMAILNFIEDDEQDIKDDLESESEDEEEVVKEYKCEKCDKVYKMQGNLLNHIKNKHPVEIKDGIKENKDDDKTNTCKICNKTLADKGKLNRHIKHVHEKSGRVKCKLCKETFSSRDSLTCHINNVHEKKTVSKCEECDFVATTPGNLKRHTENIHKHNTSQFECDICKSMYKTKTYLNLHIQTVHKKVCQTKCDLCGIILCSNKSLKYHKFSIHKI
jgi:prophage antirepressor-like protein